jgi:hypothetical protein
LLLSETGVVPGKQQLLDVGEGIIRREVDYMRLEREFFRGDTEKKKTDRSRRVVAVDFREYCKSPEKALAKVYGIVNGGAKGAGGKVPAEITKAMRDGEEEHGNRSKMKYYIKLKLGEFGVDEEKVRDMVGGLWEE